MHEKDALTIILALGIAGMLFSGYLTWGEVFAPQLKCLPDAAAPSCGANVGLTELFGLPVCIYGFAMYTAITLVSGCALFGKKKDGKKRK
jgi:uncharacterized membrane protein